MSAPKNVDSPISKKLQPVLLSILPGDIDEMECQWIESGVFEPAAKNALLIALKRILTADAGPVSVQLIDGLAGITLGQHSYSLGENLGSWMGRATLGSRMEPIEEIVWLPRDSLPMAMRQLPVVKAI